MSVGVGDFTLASAGINNILTGVARKDLMRIKFYDRGGKSQTCICELAEDALGFAAGVDLSTLFSTVTACSDAVVGEVELVIKIKDHNFIPAVEAPVSSNVGEVGHFAFNTQIGVRSFTLPSLRDDLVRPGSKDDIEIAAGIIFDNAAKNLVDEFTGEGILTSASLTLDNMWASSLQKAYRKRGRTFRYRESR